MLTTPRSKEQKKKSEVEIRVPDDWAFFIRSIGGKKMKVVDMKQDDFFNYSPLKSAQYIRRKFDTQKRKVEWLNIRWLKYEKHSHGKFLFKYNLNPDESFRELNISRNRKQLRTSNKSAQPEKMSGPRPIMKEKKDDLISLLEFIEPIYHSFYQNLCTHNKTTEEHPDDYEEEAEF